MIFAGDHIQKHTAAKDFFSIFILLAILIFPINSEAKEKDCQYCNKYERMEDWPVSERPKEFIYEEFSLSVETFAKDKFLENNNNILINFLLRYVTIKPNDLEIYEDNDLNIILKAKQHLDLEEYNESLNQILILDPSGKYFKKWIDQLALFLEFELTLMKVE